MTTVLLADDHAAVRAGLTMLFDATPDIQVVATCTDGDEVVGAAERTRPDVVLMDLRMRRVDGLTATRMLLAAQPEARVVVLTGSPSREAVLGARAAGSCGLLVKGLAPGVLVDQVRCVAAGGTAWCPEAITLAEAGGRR